MNSSGTTQFVCDIILNKKMGMKMQKQPCITYAFIDSQNLNLAVKNDVKKSGKVVYQGWKLDYQKFYIYLRDKFIVQKAFLFIGRVEGNQPLYDSLERFGYTLVFKPTLVHDDGNGNKLIKGNVDAELVLHTMIEFPHYDKAIIVSGDGDYACLIQYLVDQNKLSRLLLPNEYQYSSLLRPYHDYFDFVSNKKRKLELK